KYFSVRQGRVNFDLNGGTLNVASDGTGTATHVGLRISEYAGSPVAGFSNGTLLTRHASLAWNRAGAATFLCNATMNLSDVYWKNTGYMTLGYVRVDDQSLGNSITNGTATINLTGTSRIVNTQDLRVGIGSVININTGTPTSDYVVLDVGGELRTQGLVYDAP